MGAFVELSSFVGLHRNGHACFINYHIFRLETPVIPMGMGIEQSTQQSIYTSSALQIVLLCVNAPRGLFRVPLLPYSHVSVAAPAIPPDALEACSAAETAAEVPKAVIIPFFLPKRLLFSRGVLAFKMCVASWFVWRHVLPPGFHGVCCLQVSFRGVCPLQVSFLGVCRLRVSLHCVCRLQVISWRVSPSKFSWRVSPSSFLGVRRFHVVFGVCRLLSLFSRRSSSSSLFLWGV